MKTTELLYLLSPSTVRLCAYMQLLCAMIFYSFTLTGVTCVCVRCSFLSFRSFVNAVIIASLTFERSRLFNRCLHQERTFIFYPGRFWTLPYAFHMYTRHIEGRAYICALDTRQARCNWRKSDQKKMLLEHRWWCIFRKIFLFGVIVEIF